MTLISDIYKQISALNSKLKEIQELCSHPEPAVTKTYSADTDTLGNSTGEGTNYYHCSLCDKKWSERTGKRWR